MRLRILLALAAAFVAKDDRPGDCGSSKPGCAGTWTRGLVSTDRVILEDDGTLAVYDSGTGSLAQDLPPPRESREPAALAVHGSVANFGNGTVVFLPFAKVAAAVS